MNKNDERDRELYVLAGILKDICIKMADIEMKTYGASMPMMWKNHASDIDNVLQHVVNRRYGQPIESNR